MNSGKTRSYLIGLVGGYMVYLVYQLFRNGDDPEGGMSPAMRIVWMVFFSLAGIGLLVYAVRMWRKADREEKEEKEGKKPPNPPKDDGDALK